MTVPHLPKLSSYTLPWPTNWDEVFGTTRPLILEIGFGYGQFLEHLQSQNPDANIIGIEISNRCLVRMEDAIPRKGLYNVRVIHSRAETALHHLFTPGSISQIHVNFPDPWFKDRHSGRRLMQRDTLNAIVSRLTPDGMFYLATDITAYAEMSAELLASTPGLTNLFDSPWVGTIPGRIMTKYERKARQEGRECYYFAYRRNDYPAPSVPVIEERPMPHLVIKTPLGLNEMLAKFRQGELKEIAEGETRINFMYSYQGENNLLFEVYVHEPTIDQRVAIVLVKRDQPNEYTLKLSVLGNPRPTDGLHKAIGVLGNWLANLHPDAEIVKNKVRE